MKKILAIIVLSIISLPSFAQDAAVKTEALPIAKNINPSARPEVVKGTNIYITADFLYWKIVQEGLIFATTGVRATDAPLSTSISKGSEHTPDFGWSPGFKVGMGFKLPHDYWDLFAKYTWIETSGNGNTATSSDNNLQEGFILSLNSLASFISEIDQAETNWSQHFNVIDLELAHSFYISQYLSLRPYGGLKFTWQKQNWKSNFQAQDISINKETNIPGRAISHQDHHTWGAGVRTGLDTNWFFNKNFLFFANTALSALWISYDVDREDTFTQDNHDPVKVLDVHRGNSSAKAVVELQVGLQGQWWLANDTYYLSFSAAFEQQVWVNYASYIFILSDPRSDLTTQGLTVKARFDF